MQLAKNCHSFLVARDQQVYNDFNKLKEYRGVKSKNRRFQSDDSCPLIDFWLAIKNTENQGPVNYWILNSFQHSSTNLNLRNQN